MDALGAADPDESLSITITGIPPDATLSNTNGDTLTHPGGSITFTQAMLTAGVLTGPGDHADLGRRSELHAARDGDRQ